MKTIENLFFFYQIKYDNPTTFVLLHNSESLELWVNMLFYETGIIRFILQVMLLNNPRALMLCLRQLQILPWIKIINKNSITENE